MSEKVAIITAGGSGMGADAAQRLARDGYRVSILSSSGKGEAIARELDGIGVTGSNQSDEDLQKLVDQTMSRWGRVDVVINSAGHGPRGEIAEIPVSDWIKGMEVYFLNVVRMTSLVTPIMLKQKAGTIINISSYSAASPEPLFPTSTVCRAALTSFTRLFARAHAANNVRMNNILPGFVDSMAEEDEYMKLIPMARYASMHEISSFISYLASDVAAYITGQDLVIDGGIVA